MKWDEQARLLRRKASEDEHSMAILLADSTSPDSAVGFHGQQTMEKLLKALLSHQHVAFARTHDLIELLDLLTTNGLTVPAEIDDCRRLQLYAVTFRYDDLPVEASAHLDRQWLITRISQAREWVDGFLDKPSTRDAVP